MISTYISGYIACCTMGQESPEASDIRGPNVFSSLTKLSGSAFIMLSSTACSLSILNACRMLAATVVFFWVKSVMV